MSRGGFLADDVVRGGAVVFYIVFLKKIFLNNGHNDDNYMIISMFL